MGDFILIFYKPEEIEENISKIATEMIMCEHLCKAEEIVCNKADGQSPRCLFFEYEKKDFSIPGWIIVGLNPAPASKDDVALVQSWHKDGLLNYKNMLNAFLNSDRNGKFY